MAKTASVKSTQRPIDRILSPFQEFFQQEASSGVLLIVATVLALLWANSQLSDSYFHLWETQVSVRAGQYGISKDLLHWINDGLMVIFFFVVGLEIKREVLVGELSSPRLAALPIVAAIGGMIVPAIIYVAFNLSGPARSGWAIPMATDIAFALGVLSLLGKRVPLSLKVLLTALAIVDDLGAVLVIAIFYTSDIAWTSLLVAGFVFVVLTIMNRMGVRSLSAYAIVGVCLWLAFLQSGIHATIAGVLLAMTIPVRTRINADEFASNTRIYLDEFQKHSKSGTSILTNKNQLAAIASIEVAAEHAQTPLQRMEHILHPWVSHVIMPVFAFANAGVTISGDLPTMLTQSVTLGVMAGLIFGKQIGVFAASYLAIKFKWADLPSGMTWIRLYGLAWLAGIGFTMSLFIAGLAFMDSKFLDFAKVGILFASVISGTVGAFILSRAKR